jgi:hypothetical protein
MIPFLSGIKKERRLMTMSNDNIVVIFLIQKLDSVGNHHLDVSFLLGPL